MLQFDNVPKRGVRLQNAIFECHINLSSVKFIFILSWNYHFGDNRWSKRTLALQIMILTRQCWVHGTYWFLASDCRRCVLAWFIKVHFGFVIHTNKCAVIMNFDGILFNVFKHGNTCSSWWLVLSCCVWTFNLNRILPLYSLATLLWAFFGTKAKRPVDSLGMGVPSGRKFRLKFLN